MKNLVLTLMYSIVVIFFFFIAVAAVTLILQCFSRKISVDEKRIKKPSEQSHQHKLKAAFPQPPPITPYPIGLYATCSSRKRPGKTLRARIIAKRGEMVVLKTPDGNKFRRPECEVTIER